MSTTVNLEVFCHIADMVRWNQINGKPITPLEEALFLIFQVDDGDNYEFKRTRLKFEALYIRDFPLKFEEFIEGISGSAIPRLMAGMKL